MTKIRLITSPTKINKKNFKYLNYGCINLNHENLNDKILIKHPWDSKRKYYQDIVKIERIYSSVLREISNTLNKHHKIKKNIRYWKIVVGPWLHSFIVAYYDKNIQIDLLLKNRKKIIIPITNTKIEDQIPNNFFVFFTKHIYASSWHDYLFSLIIKKKNIRNNFIFKKINSLRNERLTSKTDINFLTYLKKRFLNFVNFIFLPVIRNQPLVFFNSYLSLKSKLFLILRNFSLPIHFDESKKLILPNILLRKSLSNKYKNKNNFYSNILKSSFLNIPTDFLENFNNVGKNVLESKVAKNPKVIFTANGVYISSVQSRYIAECTSKGSKLILAQHGGRYRNIQNFFNFKHEVDISDYFVSWGGRKNNSKIKNLGIIKSFKTFKRKDNYKYKNILYLMMNKGRFLRNIDSEISIKDLYNYYHKICPNFYTYLEKNLKKKLIYRSGEVNYWNEKELLKKKCKLSKIDFNRHDTDLFSEAEKSKIVVCSYLSTTFLELMTANIPVILFTPFSHKGYNTETLKVFNQMKKNQIYFTDYKNAAKFINRSWNNINDWWFSKNTQKCRKNFLNNFSIPNERLAQDIQKVINSTKN